MEDDGSCFKCRRDLNKGKAKYVAVSFQNKTRLFHPECHQCSVCEKQLRSGQSYTVEPKTGLAICEKCWQTQHGSSSSLPSASGGVSWTPKAPSEKGFVWSQVTLLDHANPAEAIKAQKEARQVILGTCQACKAKIYDDMIRLEGGKVLLHLACHKCATCKSTIADASYFLDGTKTVCEACISKKLAGLSVSSSPPPAAAAPPKQTSLGTCHSCSKTINGKGLFVVDLDLLLSFLILLPQVVSANGKNYCAGCLKVRAFSPLFFSLFFIVLFKQCLKCSRVISGQDAFFNRENGVICETCGS